MLDRLNQRVDWGLAVPVLSLVVLAATWTGKPPALVLAVAAVFLVAAVLAAVHHAEVVAQRVGEPFGALILAIAVTVIEVGPDRDADGLERCRHRGACTRHRVRRRDDHLQRDHRPFASDRLAQDPLAEFNAEGTAAALATVITLATICLVLPQFTTSAPGPEFTSSQLVFAAIASLALYLLFVFVQTIRHRDALRLRGRARARR